MIRISVLTKCFLFIAISIASGQAPQSVPIPGVSPTPISAVDQLKVDFRSKYDAVIEDHKMAIRKAPVITQDLLNMTLHRSDGTKERFSMEKKLYFLMAHTSHPPLTVYSLLRKEGFGTLSQELVAELKEYSGHLAAAEKEVSGVEIDNSARARIYKVLSSTRSYIDKIIASGKTSPGEFKTYVTPLRPLISDNLHVGANEQIRQFKTQMEKWRNDFPNEDWSNLRVAVLGFHQPREQYALKLFFQWLLKEPTFERRVVYAEYQDSFSGANREKAENLAIELLTKVDFELDASTTIFGRPEILQVDVMGPAAVKIIRDLKMSTWPKIVDTSVANKVKAGTKK